MEDKNKTRLIEIIEKYKDEGLISVLQKTQEAFNYLSEETIVMVSKYMKIPLSKIYGVITFYHHFSLKPHGKYTIRVCRGTACHVKGGEENLTRIKRLIGIKENEVSEDFIWGLETVACVGACALAPVVMINDEYYGKMNLHKTEMIINHYRAIEKTGEYIKYEDRVIQ
ncbi:MAG: NAD(P)H-dependent oxidoreductase subunit E [bacterium]